jgi:hypothetical protein
MFLFQSVKNGIADNPGIRTKQLLKLVHFKIPLNPPLQKGEELGE